MMQFLPVCTYICSRRRAVASRASFTCLLFLLLAQSQPLSPGLLASSHLTLFARPCGAFDVFFTRPYRVRLRWCSAIWVGLRLGVTSIDMFFLWRSVFALRLAVRPFGGLPWAVFVKCVTYLCIMHLPRVSLSFGLRACCGLVASPHVGFV
ncbi:unnamed protein product [Ectocarpus sp. 12 AP-2014]